MKRKYRSRTVRVQAICITDDMLTGKSQWPSGVPTMDYWNGLSAGDYFVQQPDGRWVFHASQFFEDSYEPDVEAQVIPLKEAK